MGNRAIVKAFGKNIGVYLHWNGGRDSVEAFLEYCKLRGFREFDGDGYGMARFVQVVSNFFGGDGLSIGIETNVHMHERCSPGDNGIYEVKGWEIVGRCDAPRFEQQEYDIVEFMKAIDKSQPEKQRIGEKFFDAEIVDRDTIKVGDIVFMPNTLEGGYVEVCVIGIGEKDKRVNGQYVTGIPYVGRWGVGFCKPEDNINNYLWEKKYHVIKNTQENKED